MTILLVPQVLTPDEISQARALMAQANWSDGRATAGPLAAQVKNNQQLPHDCEAAQTLRNMVLKALDRHPAIFPSALPRRMLPPGFNRYSGSSNAYGRHVDNAVHAAPETGALVRTDISCTLFLSDPASYDGGELVIVEGHSEQRVKLPAGHLVLYPGNSVHEVTPVTRGERLASFFWIESMVRDDAQRRILLDMDVALNQLRQQHGDNPATVALTGAYHNLLRMWANT